MTDQTIQTMTPGLQPGDRLAHFEVEEQMASGGMGIVWRGQDRLLGRRVAIKQIAEAAAVDEIFRQRFRQEAELQKRVSQAHPNIVNVIDFIDDPRGLFIVMEFVEGLSLDRVLAQMQNPVVPMKALVVIRDVALALQAIHGAGVVHRDLKPGNILVSQGPVKVCDFGLAALMSEAAAGGAEMGTAQYMAPELFSGGAVDGRADVYSLGMIAYEMLAGRGGFEQVFKPILRDQRNQPMRWMKWHTNQKVTAQPLNQINPAVPPMLSELVERMMTKDASQRITVDQLLETLRRHFSKAGAAMQQPPLVAPSMQAAVIPGAAASVPQPITSGGGGGGGPATAPLPKKNRRLLYILGGVTLINVLLLVGVLWWWPNYQRQQTLATQVAAADQQFTDALDDFEDGRFGQAQPTFAGLAEQWGDHPKLGVAARGYALLSQAQLLMTAADQKMQADDYTAALTGYQDAAEAVDDADSLRLPPEAGKLTDYITRFGDEVSTRRSFVQQAVNIDRAIAGGQFEDARRVHKAVRDAGGVLTPSEQNELADLGVRIAGQEAQAQIREADAQAQLLMEQGKFLEARNYLTKVMQRLSTDPRLSNRLTEISRKIDLNNALREAAEAEAAGNLPEAAAAMARAVEIEKTDERQAKLNQLKAQVAFTEGQALESQGSLAAAGQKYQQAVALAEHPEAMARLRDLKMANEKSSILAAAETAVAANDFEQAVQLYRNALELSPDAETQGRLNEAMVRMHVKNADGHLRSGDLDAARAELQKALGVNASDAQAASLMESLENRAKYLGLIETGDKLRAAIQYGPAKATYQRAIDLARGTGIDATQATQRKLDTEFEHLIAQARSAMDVSLWTQARAYLITARGMKPDDARLNELLAEVEKHVAK